MNRRDFLQGASHAFAGAAILAAPRAGAAASPFARLDATAQAQLVASGQVSPSELVEDAIARIEALNPDINAIVTPLFDQARTAARGPLPEGPFKGAPYAIKDLLDLRGSRRTSGSRLLANHVSPDTAPIVARSLDAGFVVVGKTNTPEFALNGSTESLLLGPCRNPWDLTRSSGGSSGGAAAAVASGMLPVAHASDGGGSIRIPASCCGVFGLKPSRGRMVGSDATNLAEIGVEHCVSRSVRDSARVFAWNERRGAAAPLPPIGRVDGPSARRQTIALATRDIYGREPSPAVKAEIERVARLCQSLGHRVEEASLPVDGDEFLARFMVVWGAGAARVVGLAHTMKANPDDVLEPWTLHLAEYFAGQPAEALPASLAYFATLSQRFDAFFQVHDAMLSPVVNAEAPKLGYLGPRVAVDTMWDRLTRYVSYTPVHNVAGTPAMSVPLGRSPTGLPIGSQFAARIGGERALFELAYELEAAEPWAGRQPPHTA